MTQGAHAEQLLQAGEAARAAELFQGMLARVGASPSYGRALVLSQLARCANAAGLPGEASARLREAMSVVERLAPNESVARLRGTLQTDLGDALRAAGRSDEAEVAYEAALAAADRANDRRAQAVNRGQLGTLALAGGRLDDALAHYEAALQLCQLLDERPMEAAVRHQLGRVFRARQEGDEAARHLEAAARIHEDCGNAAGAGQSWNHLAILNREAGRAQAAEECYRRAVDAHRQARNLVPLGRDLGGLADLIRGQPGRLAEARRLAEESLAVVELVDSTSADVWTRYGLLAEILDTEAAAISDDLQAGALRAQARDYRQLEEHAPRIVATLAHVGRAPSFGRAVVLARLGRCYMMGGRPDLAVAWLRESLATTEQVAAADHVTALRGTLHAALGDAWRTLDRWSEAKAGYEAALCIAEERRDLLGQGASHRALAGLAATNGSRYEARSHRAAALRLFAQLDEPALAEAVRRELDGLLPQPEEPDEAESRDSEPSGAGAGEAAEGRAPARDRGGDTDIMLHDAVTTDVVFDTDLLVGLRRERRNTAWTGDAEALAADARPVLVPGGRSWVDDDGAIRFALPEWEPAIERDPACVIMRRTRREVSIAGRHDVVWRVIRAMDGARSVGEIVGALPPDMRPSAARLLAALAAAGIVDASGRAIGRFLHSATKKGVLPGGGLSADDVLRLATDGNYRAYPGVPRLPVSGEVPERLHAFHALTRARRSYRDYLDRAVTRGEFDAILSAACGVTGTLPRAEREVKLRAYPSSGALYAVEVYPVAFRVDGLPQAVYHYRAAEGELELVRPNVDRARIIGAALPADRDMLANAAALICLAGLFPRHESKYGEGGYRMLVAEAGHISQNLVLAATALGLAARPFGGVFDDLLNRELGLDGPEEQFLLAVLVGHVGGKEGA